MLKRNRHSAEKNSEHSKEISLKMTGLNVVVLLLAVTCLVSSKPTNKKETDTDKNIHSVEKRFIHPSLTSGDFNVAGFNKIRTKRSEDECEKLRLCRLHARANRSFFAAFELYFVNREHARLWDHQAHSLADCNQRYNCYDR